MGDGDRRLGRLLTGLRGLFSLLRLTRGSGLHGVLLPGLLSLCRLLLAALAGLFVAGDVWGLLAGGAELGCLGLDAGAVVAALSGRGRDPVVVLPALLTALLPSRRVGLRGRRRERERGTVRVRSAGGGASARARCCLRDTAAGAGGGEAHHPDSDDDRGDGGSGTHLMRRGRGGDTGGTEFVQAGEQDPADDDHDEPEGQEHHRHRGEPRRLDREQDAADDPGDTDDRQKHALQALLQQTRSLLSRSGRSWLGSLNRQLRGVIGAAGVPGPAGGERGRPRRPAEASTCRAAGRSGVGVVGHRQAPRIWDLHGLDATSCRVMPGNQPHQHGLSTPKLTLNRIVAARRHKNDRFTDQAL
ncbi:hypothetical protein FK268_21715 [Tsukamurella sputi]|uniref:Uncharacterized protein n=1 Tax=Tsukamurella sputi TaxID=2591848 RepID=A0A5C5RG55_9ACTN|nr:hypothetical protein FK268_21715 [Tsukamurella sputi]